ncbi:MAG TPA: radical SAM protein [Nitrospirae bacterium]|nr:radical SAM protein [Nitrospirota bacterium]
MEKLYSKMKIFHYKEKLDSLAKDTENITGPIHIRIKPTNICAHHCVYCAYRSDNLQLGKDMSRKDSIPREKMLEIIDDCEKMGVRAITFSGGGDPFYYPHLFETVTKLSATSIKFAALTNGSRLKGDLAEIFAEHGAWLRVSIDGWDDESYSKYRGVRNGEFTNVMNNIAAFKKLRGACYIGGVIIVNNANFNHIFELTSRLKNVGANTVKISPCIVGDNGPKNNEYHKVFYEQAKEQIRKATEELLEPGFEIYDSYHLLEEKFNKDYRWCPYLQILPVIGADCNVYSCQDKAYNFNGGLLGCIKNQRFMDFWFEDKSRFYKIDPLKHCDHHCVSNDKNKFIIDYLETDNGHMAFV